ncbi:MAG TPA: hypothetical protein VGM56_31205 [Byssovorax sp.]|jgi:hypothetical protein
MGKKQPADVQDFPADTSTVGKHYEVAVPDYLPSRTTTVDPPDDVTHLNSYFHLGAPHSGAWDVSQVALGEDLLDHVTTPDGFDKTLGGVRDHTDGNRIITTRQDRIEIVRGQSRTIVRADQSWEEDDDDWREPDAFDAEPSVEDHIYPTTFYEIISTTYQPGTKEPGGSAPMYGEARTKFKDVGSYKVGADTVKADFYEYVNGTNVVEIYAAEERMIEKIYGGRLLEIVSTVHADHADWEGVGAYDGLSSSMGMHDLTEYMFAHNLTEVIRAEDLLVDKLYADRMIEVMSTTHINDFAFEKKPTDLQSGDIYEYIRASGELHEELYGKNITEYMVADLNFVERIEAGATIEELTAAGGAINAITVAGGGVNELTFAGAEMIDIMMAGGVFVDVIAAIGCFVEIIAGIINVEITAGVVKADVTLAPVQLEVDFGTKFSWSKEHHKFVNEETETAAAKQELIEWQATVGELFTKVVSDDLTLADCLLLA